ncbi:MAG: exodeoxyribonuclease VII small subunit [Verrucomicrobiota bacterium]
MGKPHAKFPEYTFESALERLEQIVGEMEGDRLALEDLLARYEEGTRLVKVCQHRLDSAEKRIEIIAKEASGAVGLSEFDPSTTPAGSLGASAPVSRPPTARKPPTDDVSLF